MVGMGCVLWLDEEYFDVFARVETVDREEVDRETPDEIRYYNF